MDKILPVRLEMAEPQTLSHCPEPPVQDPPNTPHTPPVKPPDRVPGTPPVEEPPPPEDPSLPEDPPKPPIGDPPSA